MVGGWGGGWGWRGEPKRCIEETPPGGGQAHRLQLVNAGKHKRAVSRCPEEQQESGVPGSQGGGERGSTMPSFSPGVRPRAARLTVWAAPGAGGPHSTTARSSDARTACRTEHGEEEEGG